jgi:iron complex outermembrane receptor protein
MLFFRLSAISVACMTAVLASTSIYATDLETHASNKTTAQRATSERQLERITVFGQRQNDQFGSKSGIALADLPQSVQLLDVDLLRGQGRQSVGDLLRNVPSANPGYSRVGPYQSFSLKIRGFGADQLRNGMRQRYFEDIDPSALNNIGRIEVLKGPSGVLYGQSAVGGVINLVSKTPDADQTGSAGLTLGSHAQKVANADYNFSVGEQVNARLSAELERSDTFVQRQPIDRDNFALTLQHQLTENATGHFFAEYVKRETKRHAGLPVSQVLPKQEQQVLATGTQLGEPNFTHLNSFAPLYQYWLEIKLDDHWTLTPRLQYQEFNTVFGQVNLRAPVKDQPTLISRTGRQGREDDDYRIAQLDLSGTFQTGFIEHKLLLGYEGGWERGRFTQFNIKAGSLKAIDVQNPQYQYDQVAPVLDFAFDKAYNLDSDAWYLQDQIRLTEQLQVIGAVRYTDTQAGNGAWGSNFAMIPASATIWQLGLTYQLTQSWSLFSGYNTGFDVESSAAALSRTGKPLKPEESAQRELGLRWVQDDVNASIAWFEIERLNALTADPIDADFSVNDGEQKVQGIEIEGKWQLNNQLQLQGGYAYMTGEVTQSHDGNLGGRLGDLARHQLNLGANWQYNEIWSMFLQGNYSSGRPLTTASAWQLDGYRLISTGLRYQQPQWSAQLAVNNLLDEHYYTASGNAFVVYAGEPQQVSLQLQYQW